MRIHRAADVHEEQDPDVRFPRGAKDDLELARVLRRRVDRPVDVELELRPFALERAQLSERDLHLAHVEDEVRAVRLVPARVGDRHRAPSAPLRADPDAARMRAVRAERARPAGPDPAIPSVVALLLLLHPLFEELPERLHVDRLEHLALFVGELAPVPRISEPLVELLQEVRPHPLDPAEVMAEGLIEGVEVALPVHAERAGHVVEAVEGAVVEPHHERAGEGHRLLGPHLHLLGAQLEEEGDERRAHGPTPRPQRESPDVRRVRS